MKFSKEVIREVLTEFFTDSLIDTLMESFANAQEDRIRKACEQIEMPETISDGYQDTDSINPRNNY